VSSGQHGQSKSMIKVIFSRTFCFLVCTYIYLFLSLLCMSSIFRVLYINSFLTQKSVHVFVLLLYTDEEKFPPGVWGTTAKGEMWFVGDLLNGVLVPILLFAVLLLRVTWISKIERGWVFALYYTTRAVYIFILFGFDTLYLKPYDTRAHKHTTHNTHTHTDTCTQMSMADLELKFR